MLCQVIQIVNGDAEGPCIDPWGALLVTGIKLDVVPQTTTLWVCPFSQFSIIVCSSNPRTKTLSMGILGETESKAPTEVQMDSIQCPTLICQACHFGVEVYQIGQAQLVLHESILLLVISLSFICLGMFSRIGCYTLARVQMWH